MNVPHVQSPPPLVPNPPQAAPASPTPAKSVTPPKPVPAIHIGNQASPINHALSFIATSASSSQSFAPVGTHAYRSSGITPGLVRNAYV
jgi:hypothetical protein